MSIGFDTGVFVRLLDKDTKAVQLWESVYKHSAVGVVSPLSLFELRRLAYRGKVNRENAFSLLDVIPNVCEVVWTLDETILLDGTKISHTFGIPSVDALIIASLVSRHVKTIYTTAADVAAFKRQGVKVVKL